MVPMLVCCPHINDEETDLSGNMHSDSGTLTPDSVLLVPRCTFLPAAGGG